MKYINLIKVVVVLFLMIPFLSLAEDDENDNRDNLKGTYAGVGSQSCVRDDSMNPSENPPQTNDVDSIGKFTLDGRGNYVSRSDYVFIVNPGTMGQSADSCSGAYFIERIGNTIVAKIPELLCVGITTFGSPGAAPEPEPRTFFNYNVLVRDFSLIFQQGGKKAGIYSNIPQIGTPVDVETFNLPDIFFSYERRCSRTGSFNRIGRFTELTPPVFPPPLQ